MVGAVVSRANTDRIVIHADQALAPVNPLLFGQNFGPWMNTTEGYMADYQASRVTLLRFPAGNYGDENDLFGNNLDDLAALAKALNAQVAVQARLWRARPKKRPNWCATATSSTITAFVAGKWATSQTFT
jgi:hypothetical protein